jgi:regulator of replication initiation timing
MAENAEFTIKRLEIRVKNLRKQLDETRTELKNAAEQVRILVTENEKLQKQLKKHESPTERYDHNWSWVSKIVFLIKQANRPLRSAEIIALLQKKEPVLHKKTSKEKFVSAFLNVAMRKERLIPYKLSGVRGNFYCLPEWIDEEGDLVLEKRGLVI